MVLGDRSDYFLITLVLSVVIFAGKSAAESNMTDTDMMMYFSRFGYLNSSFDSPEMQKFLSKDAMQKAIIDYQNFTGIPMTGVMDADTEEMMHRPRCGMRDKYPQDYKFLGSKWPQRSLTYKIIRYTEQLSRQNIDKEIARAFAVWSKYTDLVFTPSSGRVNIEIAFVNIEHGDGEPFDGPGGTLAHALSPNGGGTTHFDNTETWTIGSHRGINLFQVAAHEFGHALGLDHSQVSSALMAPTYSGYQPQFRLDRDDIAGIQRLYGQKSRNSPQPRPQPPSTGGGSILCADPTFDTIFKTAQNERIIFKNNQYWKIDENGLVAGYPQLISAGWPGLPGNIDAAFTHSNGKTFFFKGSQYWRFMGTRMDSGFPKSISNGFSGIPNNIDAILVWESGKIFFFKDNRFWTFDSKLKPPVNSNNPRSISTWKGLPTRVTAAYYSPEGKIFFFNRDKYYRFNKELFTVDPLYPRQTRNLFKC